MINWLTKWLRPWPSGYDGDEWSRAFIALVCSLNAAQWQTRENLVLVACSAMMAESGKRELEEVPLKLVRRYLTDARRLSTRNVDEIVASWRRYSTE